MGHPSMEEGFVLWSNFRAVYGRPPVASSKSPDLDS
jgi:hypothetical protein